MPELDWVTDEQQLQLEVVVPERGDWRHWLPQLLDEHWPDWATAQPETLVAYLDEWLPTLLAPEPHYAEEPQPAEEPAHAEKEPVADVRDLGWVTEDQRARLATLPEAAGDWRAWLTDKLGELYPEWARSTPEVLAPWLEGWMPTLVPAVAAEPIPTAEPVVQERLDRAFQETLDQEEVDPELLEALAEDPELRAYLAARIVELSHETEEVRS